MDVVTGEFPMIDLGAAEKEGKDNKPSVKFLQSWKLPKMACGVTDILLGMMYCVYCLHTTRNTTA